MKKLFLLIVIFFIGVKIDTVNLFSQIAQVTDSTSVVDLDSCTYVSFLNDSLSFIDFDFNKVKWTKSTNGGSLGVLSTEVLIRFDIVNIAKTNKEMFLYLPFNYVNYIDVYFKNNPKDSTFSLLKKIGSVKGYYENERVSRSWITKVLLPHGKSSIVLRVKHLYLPLRVNSFLLSEKKLNCVVANNHSLFWLWKGIFIFAMLISIVMFMLLKQKLFLYFFLLNLGIFGCVGLDYGDLNLLFFGNVLNHPTDIQRVSNFLIIYFFPLFLNGLTPIKKYNSTIWEILKYGNYLFVILWLVTLIPFFKTNEFHFYATYYFLSFSVLTIFFMLYFLIKSYVLKEINSGVVLLIYSIFIFVAIYDGFAKALGFYSSGIIVYEFIIYASIFQVMAFMYLIGVKLVAINTERDRLTIKHNEHELEMMNAVVNSQEEERNVVGQELHDMIGANLSVIKQHSNKANSSLIKLIDDTINGVRALSHGLITPKIADGFQDEIIDLLQLYRTNTLEVRYYFHRWKTLKNQIFATHLYRIIQELMQNANKHSQATEIYIQFLNHENNLMIMYEDNGVGFNVEKKRKKGRGLINIRNRVSIIGAIIFIDSSENGTIVSIEIESNKIHK